MSKQEDMEDQYPKNIWKCFDDSTKQEEFVLNVLNEKENGYFVEVGSHHPQINNNTYNLEKRYNWNGLALEIQDKYVQKYNEQRSQICINHNALTFDYRSYFKNKNFPKQIDYLQIDVDNKPKYANLKALINIPLSEYRFSIITIEHDYIQDFTLQEMRNCQRIILYSYGYQLVVQEPDEDWWIDKSFIPIKQYWDLFKIRTN